MTTSATGARASRRAAATAARQNVQAQPPVEPEPQVIVAPEMAIEDDEPFGPEDLDPRLHDPEIVAARAAIREQIKQSEDDEPFGPATPTAPVVQRANVGGAIALPQVDLTREITAADMVIPKLRISQAMSKTNTLFQTSKGKDGVQQGNWYHSQTGENLGEIVYFIPVDMRKSRAFFQQGQGLMCRSFDLLNGEGDPGGPCEGSYEERLTIPAAHRGCPLRLWNDKTPPKCGLTYNFVGLIIRQSEIENPAKAKPLQGIMQLRSTATGSAKQMVTVMSNEGSGVWTNLVVELGIEVKTNPKGIFYVPTAEFYDTTDAPGFERIRRRAEAMSRQLGNQNTRTLAEDDDAA